MYDPHSPRTRVFYPAAISGVLLFCAYFPVNFGFLAWFALIPMLTLVDANARPRRIYFATFIGGMYWFVPSLQWIRVAHPAMYGSWLAIAVYCSVFLMFTMWTVRALYRYGVPLWLAAPIGFVAWEYIRTHFPTGFEWFDHLGIRVATGFGWYLLGHTQHDWLSLIQIADVTGVYGLTFIIVMVNAVLCSLVRQYVPLRTWLQTPTHVQGPSRRAGVVAGALLIGMVLYGIVRLQHAPFEEGPNVALIQGNLIQDLKMQRGPEMESHFEKLCDEASNPKNGPRPDLVIWPETSALYPWGEFVEGTPILKPGEEISRKKFDFLKFYKRARLDFVEQARRWPVPQLYGMNTFEWENEDTVWRYNSAVLADGRGNFQARYDKIHLVLFGEYVPFRQTLPFLQRLTPYEGDYSCKPGNVWTRFEVRGKERAYLFGVIICYEDSDPSLARAYVEPGTPPADFLVNISNDGWFDGTPQHEQHLAIARFRAVESRRSVVRAVNMGISAIIDADGRVVALPGDSWYASKKVEGIVRGSVPIDSRSSLYAQFGDWFPLACWFVIIGGFIRARTQRRQQGATA